MPAAGARDHRKGGALRPSVGPESVLSLWDASRRKRSVSVARPSSVTAEKYETVSHVYFQAVYSVRLGKAKAPDTALEKELTRITGFSAAQVEKEQ